MSFLSPLTRAAVAVALMASVSAGLVACSGTGVSSPAGSSDGSNASTMAASVTVTEAWVKAIDEISGPMPMTSVFMVVTNGSDKDVTIVGGSVDSSIAAEPLETHEVITSDVGDTVMQEAKGGVVVPAHGSVTFKPASYHLMMMNVLKPILAGETLRFMITFADGSALEADATSYSIENGQENYTPEAK